MSVIIKDFKMPKDCDHCTFQHEDDEDPLNRVWKCYITGESVGEYYEGSTYGDFPDTCPLTEVSEEVSEGCSENVDEDSKIAKQAEMVIDGTFKTTRVVIFYKDAGWAKKVYEYIRKYAPYKPQCCVESFPTLTPIIHFAERDIDVVFAPEENCCGRRCDKVFYQPGISKATLDGIVFSMWTPLKPVELNI